MHCRSRPGLASAWDGLVGCRFRFECICALQIVPPPWAHPYTLHVLLRSPQAARVHGAHSRHFWDCCDGEEGLNKARSEGSEGGGLFESRQPPSPTLPDPPYFLNTAFCNLRFWGKVLALKAPEKLFWPPEGEFFFTLCVHTQHPQNFVENSKRGEKPLKAF